MQENFVDWSILVHKSNKDKIMALDSHKLIAASGEPGDRVIHGVHSEERGMYQNRFLVKVTLIQHPATNISTFCSSSIVEVEMSVEPPPFQESARCDVCNCSFNTFNNITNAISKLDIDADVNSKTAQTADCKAAVGIKECKCGMPLCICEAPPAPFSDAPPQQAFCVLRV
ncbi:hypothetical protein K1719_028099 [Acacia pycnantha]|nr:hypothetical protein K1719_028099 [Acacia pycnantha]